LIQYRLPIWIEELKYEREYLLFSISLKETTRLGMAFKIGNTPFNDIEITIEGIREHKTFLFREETDLYYYFFHGPYVLKVLKC
jgi:hypothetical protein